MYSVKQYIWKLFFRPLNNLKNIANSENRGLDIKFVKKEVLYFIKIGTRPIINEFKQYLSSRNISKP